jgi:UDP-glucose 4-epimerase
MKALVTGADGFIGRILCRMLRQQCWDIRTVDMKYKAFDSARTGHWSGSYDDWELYVNDKYDVIFHLGASSLLGPSVRSPLSYFDNNVSRMNRMLSHIVREKACQNIIFASSAATYGDPGKDIALKEEHAGHPCNPYGWSKLMGEITLEQACLAYGLKGYSMRFFNVAGAYEDLGQDLDQPHILTKMSVARLENRTFYINGNTYDTYDGTCVRDYIHVADVCDALIAAAHNIVSQPGTSYTEYNVCSGTKTSNRELTEMFSGMFGLTHNVMEGRPGDPGYLYGDNSNTINELNWSPKMDTYDIIESHYDYVRKKMNAN